MIELPLHLQLQRGAEPGRPSAWFLAGDSIARALDELARCGLAEPDTRVYAVPRSARDRALAGFLVVPGSGSASKARGLVVRGLPCRQIAGRLYVPADARLVPPVTDDEIRALCPHPVAFLHPALGFAGFGAESALTVDALIELPDERDESWNGARPGPEPAPRLQGIAIAEPPTIDDVFGGARQEIGTAPPQGLPPAPEEPEKGIRGDVGRALRRWFAQGVRATTELFPKTAGERTWLNDLAEWAGGQLERVSQQLDQLRNTELHRLLHLLKTDPENGLRHAISMSTLPHRGVAPPGGRLGSRMLDFSAARLGGGPADFWNISEDWQEILRRKYRELADREMRLGRFRRAAYIYAELLGDLVAAANVLKQGRHYREAALLYEEHLKNPLEAARCLAEGGLLAEAAERFEKLERWLDAADLHEKLGNIPAAHALVQRVIDERLQLDDPLGAANLTEERLKDVDGALRILLGAWPLSAQAEQCLTRGFKLLGNLGRHEEALFHLSQLQKTSSTVFDRSDPGARVKLLTGLVAASQDYPDQTFRHRAADFSRVLIARQLSRSELHAGFGSVVVEMLSRLAPQDRLVVRDGQRHLQARREAERRRIQARPQPPPPATGRAPELVRRIELPRQMEWTELRSAWQWFIAAGFAHKRLTVVRGVWDGSYQSLSWPCPSVAVRQSLVLEPVGEQGDSLLLALPGAGRFPLKQFPATDADFSRPCVALTPDWMGADGVHSISDGTRWSIHVAAGRAVLSCSDSNDALRQTIDITQELLRGATRTESSRIQLQATANGAAVALGNRLVVYRGGGKLDQFELTGQATGLIGTLPHTRHGLVVLLEHGAEIHWSGAGRLLELDRDIAGPVGAFLPGGPLALLSPVQKQLLLLDYDSHGVTQVTRMSLAGQNPVAVSSTASIGQFAVLDRNGGLAIYKI